MGTPAIVDAEVGAGEFVQADPEAETIAGLDIAIFIGTWLGEGLGICKDNAAQQAVGRDAISVFGFKIEHVILRIGQAGQDGRKVGLALLAGIECQI